MNPSMDVAAAGAELVRGALAGLVVCVPPGPMSALCVARAARHGFATASALTTGAAVGDALYAAVAAFGVGALRESLGIAPRVAALVAAPLLLWMGVRMIAKARRRAAAAVSSDVDVDAAPRPLASFATGVAMSLGTPGTLPAFVALFAATAPRDAASGGPVLPVATAVGALCGALLWWAAVATTSCRLRRSVMRHLNLIDAAGGVLLLLASAVATAFAVSEVVLAAG